MHFVKVYPVVGCGRVLSLERVDVSGLCSVDVEVSQSVNSATTESITAAMLEKGEQWAQASSGGGGGGGVRAPCFFAASQVYSAAHVG